MLETNVLYEDADKKLHTLQTKQKRPEELQYPDKQQAIQEPQLPPLMFSDILYTVDTQQIIVWNIGQWGCEKHFDKITKNKTYNHKFNMDRRETFAEYKQRLINICGVLNQLVIKYPNAIFCLQEIPNIFIGFFINEKDKDKVVFNDPYQKSVALFNNDPVPDPSVYIIFDEDKTQILYKQMLDVQTMFYTQLEDNFIYNKNIDKNSSNVLIMYGKHKQLIYNEPIFLNIYNIPENANEYIFSNNRADGFYMIKDTTELIVFISVHFLYPIDYKKMDKNATIIMHIFNAIINIIKKINTILQITVYMCGDFNTSSKQHNINMKSINIFKHVKYLFLQNKIMITEINSSMYSPENAKSSLKDNIGGITEETIDYINKITISIVPIVPIVSIDKGKENYNKNSATKNANVSKNNSLLKNYTGTSPAPPSYSSLIPIASIAIPKRVSRALSVTKPPLP